METKGELKPSLVISPIGEPGTDIRKRSDLILDYIIVPIASECGYDATRADKISDPGMITTQIIQRLLEDPLVIADLTGHNANVFYELAIRHAAQKPCVQLIQKGERIPFDVAPFRTIELDHTDLGSVETCKSLLRQQIRIVEQDATKVDNPITVSIDMQTLRRSGSDLSPILDRILESVSDLMVQFRDMNISIDQINKSLSFQKHEKTYSSIANYLMEGNKMQHEDLMIKLMDKMDKLKRNIDNK